MLTLLKSSSMKKVNQEEFEKMYKLIQVIDQGTYGVVCKCQDIKNRRIVAAKVLKEEDGLEGFFRQQWIMNKIEHTNVLDCLSFYFNTTKNQYILITSFCEKQNLKKKLPEINELEQSLKIWICVQIARGINALHRENIMHRDIKPANILFVDDWAVKLCDFGFGRVDEKGIKTVKIGTPFYRDPNTTSGNYSKKCDIYSAGLVFDTIFRGKNVFNGISAQKFLIEQKYFMTHKEQIIEKLNCCPEMKEIILGCLEKQQSQRFDSVSLLKKFQQLKKLWSKYQSPAIQSKSEYIQEETTCQSNILSSKYEKYSNSANSYQEKQANRQSSPFLTKEINPNHLQNITQNIQNEIKSQSSFSEITNSQYKNLSLSTESNFSFQSNLKSYQKDYRLNFLAKLLKTVSIINNDLLENQNFIKTSNFFLIRKKKIRQLQLLSKLYSIGKNDKKVLIFIGLFGYFRFLKIHEAFLQEKPSDIKNIQGIVSIKDISQQTKKIILQLIKQQLQIIQREIKSYQRGLNNQKFYYGQKLTKKVLHMIENGQENYKQIEKFSSSQIKNEYINLLTHSRYEAQRQEENQLKQKLKSLQIIF